MYVLESVSSLVVEANKVWSLFESPMRTNQNQAAA